MFNLQQLLKKISNRVIYGGHLQSLGASGIVFVGAFLFDMHNYYSSAIVMYFIFRSIYVFDRFVGIKKDYLTNRLRTKYLRVQSRFVHIKFGIYLILSVVGLLFLPNHLYGSLLGFGILVFGFLYPICFKPLTIYIPLFKNVYVAIVFSVLVFYSYVWEFGFLDFTREKIFLSVFVFLGTLFQQIALDVKDAPGDGREGFKTLPVLLGRDKSISTLFILGFFFGIAFILSVFIFGFGIKVFLLVLSGILFHFYYILIMSRNLQHGSVLASMAQIVWIASVVVGTIII